MIYVMDAHPIVWYLGGRQRLTPLAMTAVEDQSALVVVPTTALAEIYHRFGRGREGPTPSQVRAMLNGLASAMVYPFDAAVLNEMPTGLEIHDAVIVATTRLLSASTDEPVRLITNDRQITASGLVDVVW